MDDTTSVSEITGFQFHKIVNARLAQEKLMVVKNGKSVIRTIPPQMIYNYLKKGYIVANKNGLIDIKVGYTWLEKYIARTSLSK